MTFRRFFQRRKRENAAAALYLSVVEQARQPDFYARLGVPDTLEGRYDMIILHAWLLMRRLARIDSEENKALSQAVFDRMFADMDRNLREMGVTDLRVGKRVQRMTEAFFGRAVAYDKGLEQGDEVLKSALARNLYQSDTVNPEYLSAMASYIRFQISYLDNLDEAVLGNGTLSFTGPELAP